MSALQQWHDEIALGRRTVYKPWDALFFDAQQEAADEEHERVVLAPQRAYLKEIAQRGKKKRTARPAKWERDAARMMVGVDDGG